MMKNSLKKVNVSQIEIKVKESDHNVARTQPDELEEQKDQQKNVTPDSYPSPNVDNLKGLHIRSYTCTNFN